MKRISEQAALERRRRERDPGGGALVDMRIDVCFDDRRVLSVGGLWDRRLEDYDGDAATGIQVFPHAGEMAAIEWFRGWLAVHAGRRDSPPAFDEQALTDLDNRLVDDDEVFSAMFAGGRRGGKTWTACLLVALYAVQFKNAILWCLNPNDQKHDEVRTAMAQLLAPAWIVRETVADGWELVNGSAIMLKSAYTGTDPDAIKEGKAHFVLMNEAQKMSERVYIVARGAIADHSGIVLLCANPPVQAKDEQWVGDFAADAQANRRMAVYRHFDPRENPHINRAALLSMRRELDERSYRIEILGEFLPPVEVVAYNWVRTHDGNERTMPAEDDAEWLDVTEEFLMLEEEGEGLTDLVGIDFQVHPHIGGPVFRFFVQRSERTVTRDNVVMWGVDEIVLEGDETEWCYAAREMGYQSETTLIIGDATGEYQHTRRGSADSPPPEWKGKGSFDIIKMGGFKNIVPPSRRIRRKNPDVIDRCRAFTSLIESVTKKRRLFMDPDRCPKTCKSIREWPTVHGRPSRVHDAAHLGDATSYPIVRLFPRILRSEKPGEVDPIVQRIDRGPARPKNFGSPPKARHPRDRNRGL